MVVADRPCRQPEYHRRGHSSDRLRSDELSPLDEPQLLSIREVAWLSSTLILPVEGRILAQPDCYPTVRGIRPIDVRGQPSGIVWTTPEEETGGDVPPCHRSLNGSDVNGM
jgi:hypothetical protein